MTREAMAATAWDRSTTKPHAWPATAWAHRAAPGRRARTSSWSRRHLNGCGITTGLDQIHPGFGKSRSAVLHRFGTDPEYASWRRRFCDTNQGRSVELAPEPRATSDRRPDSGSQGADRTRSPAARAVGEFTACRRLQSLSLAERNTPALFGVGHIDAIPSEVLVATAASEPEPIRGRVSRTREGRIGRFGWKAQIPSLHEFVRVACANELGLEVPGHSQATSPVAPGEQGDGAGPDRGRLRRTGRIRPGAARAGGGRPDRAAGQPRTCGIGRGSSARSAARAATRRSWGT